MSKTSFRKLAGASNALDQKIAVDSASTDQDIELAFTALVRDGAKGLVAGADPFLNSRRAQIVALAARHALPAIYEWREFVDQGGLISYGTNLAEATRQLGTLRRPHPEGRQARRPADRAADQVRAGHHLKTAQALGLIVPQSLLARADEAIE